MLTSRRNPIIIPPGVDKDDNAYTAFQWADADKIRFYRSFPQKIGGWQSIKFANSQILNGVPRSIWAYIDSNGLEHVLIGTNTRLYSYEAGSLYNITPLVTATTAIMNSLDTHWQILDTNPISVVINTPTVTLAVSPYSIDLFVVGDFIKITAAATVGGINPNGTFRVSSINTLNGTLTYQAATNATSTVNNSGGGIVELATRVLTVHQMAHGFSNGDRVKIAGAVGFGGFAAGDINIEAIIRNKTANTYDYYSTVADTSGNFSTNPEVLLGGGAGTTVQGQIAAGTCAIMPSAGYSGGTYGLGPYGIGKKFNAGFAYPRIWWFDRYQSGVVLTPGNQGGLYFWAGNIATAPVLQTAGSAPTAINYVVVENKQIIVFGAAGVPNNIMSTNDITNWVPGPTVTAFNGTIPQAGVLLSSSYCKGQVVIFAANAVFKMTFVGSPQIWIIDEIMNSDGIIAPKAFTSIKDNVVWTGGDNFYIYNGAVASTIPNNTLRQWFYSNLNPLTAFHTFFHKTTEFNEVWIFAPLNSPSASDPEEPCAYIIWNYEEGHFTNGTMTRTASEEPANPNRTQYMATGSCDGSVPAPILYAHEVPNDYTDDGNNMTGSLTSNDNLIDTGEYMQEILRVIPSTTILPLNNIAEHNLLFSMNILTKEYDGAVAFRTFGPYNIYDDTQKIDTRANGRQRQYAFTFSNKFGFRLEKFFEELRTTTAR